MYERLNLSAPGALAYRITRPLSPDEMKKIVAELEGTLMEHGEIRVLIDLEAFPYADLEALWEDLKFDVKHARDIERLALVGGGAIEKWGVRIFGKFTATSCRCFGEGEVKEAWSWLNEN